MYIFAPNLKWNISHKVSSIVFTSFCESMVLCFPSSRDTSNYVTKALACSIYNNIHPPSKLAVGIDFHCFKNKIEPKWEDPVCANGGKWTMNFAKNKSDTPWLHTVCIHHVCPNFCILCWLEVTFLHELSSSC